ncbi:uncharacterized protein LOC111357098 [Spodoptera litura]|uniref:Uncharacterized protein LOC111357098 n=1 Tax=Spodoptera litura TaxID=69820 RepID=A0A9J7EF25_SPOLT|nr:uncharacterized protein LOC111357098 [Spodoptera litura]
MDRDSRKEIGTTHEREAPLMTPDNPRFHLHLVAKTSRPSERPIIRSTKWERLSYYRALTATPCKTEIIVMKHVELNVCIWFYVLNVFFITLPHCFVHFFMATYAPEEHLFLIKMVPICFGFKYLLVMAGFCEILLCLDTVMMLFHYLMDGIIRKNPWNRCDTKTYYDALLNVTIQCYNLQEFAETFNNVTLGYEKSSYMTPDKNYIQISQMDYYRHLFEIWIRHMSRIFNILSPIPQVAGKKLKCMRGETKASELRKQHVIIDKVECFSEIEISSISLPPTIHCWYQMSHVTEKITGGAPSRSKPMLSIGELRAHLHYMNELDVFRNASYFFVLFLGITLFHQLVETKIFWKFLNGCQWGINIVDLITFIYLLAQSSELTEEQKLVNRTSEVNKGPSIFSSQFWSADVDVISESITAPAVIHVLSARSTQEISPSTDTATMVISNALIYLFRVSFVKSIFLYLLYPVGRLVDDYTFHYGAPPTKLRILSLRMVPVYYTFKFYFLMKAVWNVLEDDKYGSLVPHYKWSWFIMLIPLFVGVLVVLYKYLIKRHMTWQFMFRPMPKWGPKEFSERQLRKQFSSRYYISSEVPRLLSRYLMTKRESKVYKVDVRYDVQRRSTVTKAVGFGAINGDKKKI